MEKINLWCKTIAVISVISSLIMLLLPENGTKKAFRMLVSLVVIYVIMNPFAVAETDFSFVDKFIESSDGEDIKASLEYFDKLPVISAVESETEKYIDDIIKNTGADGKCKVSCEYLDDKVKINEIVLYGIFAENIKKTVEAEIRKICGEDALIIYGGENNE